MRVTSALMGIALALAACSPTAGEVADHQPASAAATHPVSALQIIPLTVTRAGKALSFRVELARSADEQARGLMFRTSMGADEGMIFPMDPPRDASFWMRNTVMPLDIIFVGPGGRILNIAANTVPYSEAPVRSVGAVIAVLELNAGRAAQLGIVPGDVVKW